MVQHGTAWYGIGSEQIRLAEYWNSIGVHCIGTVTKSEKLCGSGKVASRGVMFCFGSAQTRNERFW